jgi:protein ImuB
VAALGLTPDIVAGLRLAGLGRIEDLWLRPRGPIAARFGRQVISRLEAAFGLGRSAISPRLEAPPYVTERRFFDPILTLEDVERTIIRLTTEMAALLQKHGDGARRLEVMLFRVDGASFRIKAGASRPTRAAEAMAALFHERLKLGVDERDVAFGFDVVRLCVMEAARLDEAAPALDRREGEEDLARLVDRLGARLGEGAVRRIALADAHLPEQAAIDRPVGFDEARRRSMAIWNPTRVEHEPVDRPILLFARPEPIETLASLPDGPPVRFRWRRVLHEVAAVEGPERLSPPWWKTPPGSQTDPQRDLHASQQAATRDYFRAEDRQGRRFWIYREGLYESAMAGEPPPAAAEPAHAPSPPRWFVHGLFG